MNVLIAYASYYGSTERCAYKIKERLRYLSSIVNVSYFSADRLQDYDAVIIGSPIHIGRIHRAVRKFLESNKTALAEKDIYLFLCGLDTDIPESVMKDIPDEIKNKIVFKSLLGGEIVKDNLSGFEKMGIETMEKKMKTDFSNLKTIDDNKIEEFIGKINEV
ncbi:MAG TPA: flavodoxin domain-containing protein [Spirochaetota bacterium]|jgi:menaquinone-dependent protoporphyrinogen oxidase|nr:MAG: protoporphyrinogen oxidase [Spirochaetes bacterium ADurb.Bin133]HNZ25963.1 flavodoxin domain-containing protein [Spirochaetota bacterium]HOE99901.1 flavodoxin domain-containing protein [Spirochaetota bacterium]HOS31607.1 flavodoxin domain-containing protein [Spirochaetota bacterium]HOS54794.1 flavodoxin domain-containing protein [Spirochaetota bacterium]